MNQWIPDILLELNLVSTLTRLFLSLLCGGLLGLERERKKRPAGLRTYILVCMGSTLVMLTNLYLTQMYGTVSDPSRMGAQVISGIGFLGAGTIVVTGRNHVRGLTTAAGLWAAACVGLSLGVGFYWGAILGCSLVFIVMSTLHRLDAWTTASAKYIGIYAEFKGMPETSRFLKECREQGLHVSDLEVIKTDGLNGAGVGILCTIRMLNKQPHSEFLDTLSKMEGVLNVEEM